MVLTRTRLTELLGQFSNCRVAVWGDFCLDAYWTLDPAASQPSIETGKPTQVVRQQRYALGGAGNVVKNLAALGVQHIAVFGVVGDDLFGREMRRQLVALDVDAAGLLTQDRDWATPVYAKPYVDAEELSRIDFGGFNALAHDVGRNLTDQLAATLSDVQAVIVNQQLDRGINTAGMIERLNEVIARHPRTRFIVDSRHHSDAFAGAILKINAVEAARLTGANQADDDVIPLPQVQACARQLCQRLGQPIFISRSDRGILAYDGQEMTEVPGLQILTPTDPVGAGDTTVAALTACLSLGVSVAEAAELANMAAAVTTAKVQQTGTASPDEILALGAEPNYIYRPELADDPRQAHYWADTEIEVIRDDALLGYIKHAVFDHDGTISVLRQGWEQVMEPMMVRAILGPQYEQADETAYHQVVHTVRHYIDQSTGCRRFYRWRLWWTWSGGLALCPAMPFWTSLVTRLSTMRLCWRWSAVGCGSWHGASFPCLT